MSSYQTCGEQMVDRICTGLLAGTILCQLASLCFKQDFSKPWRSVLDS